MNIIEFQDVQLNVLIVSLMDQWLEPLEKSMEIGVTVVSTVIILQICPLLILFVLVKPHLMSHIALLRRYHQHTPHIRPSHAPSIVTHTSNSLAQICNRSSDADFLKKLTKN